MDVHLTIHGRHDLAGQLYRQLRTAILEGRLVAGERLPSTRDLALQIGVSRKTTLDVFERLIAEGYLQARAGSGTFVAEATGGLRGHAPQRSPAEQLASPVPPARAFATPWNDVPDVLPMPRTRIDYDFVGGVTEKRLFPFDTWRRCVSHALRQQARGRGAYHDPAGDQSLRLAVSRYLAFSRAVVCTWADILVTHGAQQAIDLIARVVVRPGDTVAVEDPGYPPVRIALQALGANVVPVPVDAEGLVVEALPPHARLVYVTPSHQFPLGMPMSLARRAQLLDWAQHHDALIVEDDYDSEFRFDGRPMESLKSLDAAGCVAYVGTFSKTIFPELRIGYAVPPPSLVAPLRRAKQVADWHSESLMQAALAKFMLDGDFGKYLRRMHKEYAARRHALLRHLRGSLARWMAPVPSTAGIHMAAQLRPPLSEATIVQLAQGVGVGLYGMERMYVATAPQPGLLVGYGHVNVAEIDSGLSRLTDALAKVAP
ncbi:HTH-type transcriptional regulatory protein GabR [Ralstonia condita]|uniref:HTH-type transcriptional regulatory protein GabR n=1 Tax=Ralstonia condita TaxID=3058600 RepID=A0ABN9J0P4_9RALS|nr:PLP-dependent aminotransferase family protein [Ralstonia sp. LMG 7141]CAJ0791875.1 HTH-type transcriptional regulatory protein GabR [Ralstonia sp. LMG 7141]